MYIKQSQKFGFEKAIQKVAQRTHIGIFHLTQIANLLPVRRTNGQNTKAKWYFTDWLVSYWWK